MKKIGLCLLLGLLTSFQIAQAHDDASHQHGHIAPFMATLITEKTITQLTQQDAGLGFGILPTSWNQLPSDKIKLHKSGDGYFIMAATNNAESKTIYVLMSSENGNVYDVNFTGEFKGLKE